MPHFCNHKDHVADTYICQKCARILCSIEDRPEWLPLTETRSGNVCPKCVTEGPPIGGTDWVEVAREYIDKHGSMSAAEVRALNEPYKDKILDNLRHG